jgi:hypothetical protein
LSLGRARTTVVGITDMAKVDCRGSGVCRFADPASLVVKS